MLLSLGLVAQLSTKLAANYEYYCIVYDSLSIDLQNWSEGTVATLATGIRQPWVVDANLKSVRPPWLIKQIREAVASCPSSTPCGMQLAGWTCLGEKRQQRGSKLQPLTHNGVPPWGHAPGQRRRQRERDDGMEAFPIGCEKEV